MLDEELGARRCFEVLPALGAEFESCALVIHEDDVPIPSDVADLADDNARDSRGNTLAAGRGEKQFVIVAAVQCEL